MTDTNGHVAAAHLGTFAGYPVSLAILPDLHAADRQFHAEGYTFGLVLGFPGYRDWDTQGAMQRAFDAGQFKVAPFYLSGAPGTRPANQGHSQHGFGRAIDVFSNAPLARRDAILAAHGFHLWTVADRNHYDWGNALQPAELGGITIDNTTQKDDTTMRLIGLTNGAGILVTDNGTLGLGSQQEYALMYRIINSNQALAAPLHAGEPFPDTFNAAELAIIDDLLARANDSGPTVAATTTPLLSEADLAKIAAGVDAALADNFATQAAAIEAAIIAKLPTGVPLTDAQVKAAVKSALTGATITPQP